MTDAVDTAGALAPSGPAGPAQADGGAQGDDDLVAAWLQGDEPAFAALYARHRGPVFRFFVRQLPEAQAHDLFQDTWMRLITALPGYRARGTFQAYLFSIAHNVLMDHHRKRLRQAEVTEAEPPEAEQNAHEEPPRQLERERLRQRLFDLLRKLPVNQRTVWLMRQETGLSLAEIADLTGTSQEGVKSRLRYANEKLKAGLQRYVES